jgi:phage repressor protein C with HTH and peptisase S24 domain
VKTVPVIRKKTVIPKKAVIKTKKPLVKTKTPISHLIKKSNPTVVKTPLSTNAKTEVKQLQTAQVEASKKAMKSDSKISKVVKVIAVVGVLGATGFGIYKFIQNKKLKNGHISTSK